jgi:translocator protein
MINRSVQSQSLGLLGWISLVASASTIGGLAITNDVSFYGSVARPSWAPPAWLFGPAWTVLYLLMAIAVWLVWRRHGFGNARTALTLFVVQLAANALWTWLFFAWRQGGLALAELIVLWVMIAITIAMFARLHRVAAALLVPYLLWVTFAGALNFTLWRMNPAVL